ncbi:LysR family transcriptional regulator [Methyloraptor flagellatus]|jgi:DNA-binding transcriptional LysR family regulator|uniref:LysR family transcriptional regulator n=1 Tax=Methyloraptor flagellatus TaxID=3162530 RepID=A0AAU7X4M5_9HYPH
MILFMREVNLAGLDLDLLPALDALLRRRNVTRAANDVGLSQPAMSRALARLRALFGDPLLVRSGGGLVPTPMAERLAPRVVAALEGVRAVFREPSFDPSAVTRTIRLAATDAQGILILPGLVARLGREAPGIDLQIEAYGPDLHDRLSKGTLDAVFGLANQPLPAGTISEPIVRDRLALVMRRGHPRADTSWTLADYASVDHVAVSIFGDGRTEIDAALAAIGLTRRIALVTPSFATALATVAAGDMVATLAGTLARRFVDAFDLKVVEAPVPNPILDLTLVSHAVRASDPVLVWFRALVRAVAEEVHATWGDAGPRAVDG